MTADMVASLLTRLGLGLVDAAIAVARALTSKVDAAAVKARADSYFKEAGDELAAAEARERASFTE